MDINKAIHQSATEEEAMQALGQLPSGYSQGHLYDQRDRIA